jgi:hypothetical protein
MDILKIDESYSKDESIEKYEYHEYTPVSGSTNLSNGNEIRLVIETQDLFTHPSESYLIIKGSLLKENGTRYVEDDKVSVINNAMMYLFQHITYSLSGQEIEKINYPGQATTMLGLLKYPKDFSDSQGMNQLWFPDVDFNVLDINGSWVRRKYTLLHYPDPKGTFSFRIPLKFIFGFCEDYNKVVYGFKHQLTLYRKSDDNDVIQKLGDDAGKIKLDKVSWFMPHVMPSDEQKMKLYKMIENKKTVDVAFRNRQCDSISVPQSTSFDWRLSVKSSPEKPRWIIIGFQTDKNSNQEKNPGIFDNLDCKNIHVNLNSRRYPEVDYNLSFPKQQFSRAYGDAAEFRSKFYKMDELISNPNFMPYQYKELFPLFVFDVSKQSERLKHSVIDILVKATFNKNVPASTEAFAVVISDRLLSFESDGNKMNVITN